MPMSRLAAAAVFCASIGAPALAVDCSVPGVLCVPEEQADLATAFRTVPDGGTIDIAPGIYPSPTNGFTIGTTTLQKNRSFTVRARVSGQVTLTGQNARIVVSIRDLNAARWITFEGLRFVNGRTTAADFAGGVSLRNARATFFDCEFTGNRAAGGNGGAALGLYGSAKALIIDSLFEDNRGVSDGAAIFAQKGSAAPNDQPSELWVLGTTFRNNCETGAALTDCTSGDGAGGAVLIRNSHARIADSLFENNTAGYVGGAIYAYGDFACNAPYCAAPAADLLIVRSRFHANRADGSNAPARTEAGAIHVEDCARLRLYASTVEDNFADWGGGLESYRARLEVYDSIFRRNRATSTGTAAAQGGAILAMSGPASAAGCPSHTLRDYPAPSVHVERSLVEGGSPAPFEAQQGGCLVVGGDAGATTGACQTTHVNRCAQLTMQQVALIDCAVGKMSTPNAVFGGGFQLNRAHASLSDVLVARGRAVGLTASTCASGAGGSVFDDTTLIMNGVLFSGNLADCPGQDNLFVAGAPAPQATNVRFHTATATAPNDGMLLAVPPKSFADTPLVPAEAWLAWGWAGSSARLDGLTLSNNPKNGRQLSGNGVHTLEVAGGAATDTASITAALPHSTELLATPPCTSGSSTLSWTIPTGNPIAAFVDQNVAGGSANGSATVSAAGTTTYRRITLAREGGARDEVTVHVGSCPVIFIDGFQSGGTGAWSLTVP